MRVGAIIIVAIMLTAPASAIISTRPAHNIILDTFVPEPADVPAEFNEDTCVNLAGDECGNDGPDQRSNGEGANGQPDQLARDDDGNIQAGIPPFYECGDEDLELRIGNPFALHVPDGADKETQSILRADGGLYVIPRVLEKATGEPDESIEAVWFGFLHTTLTVNDLSGQAVLGPDQVCDMTGNDAGIGVSGAYYEFYRGDTTPQDGWLIPINTHLVPDNIYGAVLRAFGPPDVPSDTPPGGLAPVKTGFIYAIVDNTYEDEPKTAATPDGYASCQPPDCENRDLLPPWPAIVPGDVSISQAENGADELIVEFGEAIVPDSFSVTINGVTPSTSFEDSTPRDVDSFPLFTFQTTSYGKMVKIDRTSDPLEPGDVVIVSAVDEAGNQATKTVTIS